MHRLKFFVLALLVLTALVGGFAKDTAFAGEGIAIEDRVMIQDLISRYGRTYDDRDAEGWAALFTDGTMPIYIVGKLARELNTNEERKKWAQSGFETFEKDGVFKTRHYQTRINLLIAAIQHRLLQTMNVKILQRIHDRSGNVQPSV